MKQKLLLLVLTTLTAFIFGCFNKDFTDRVSSVSVPQAGEISVSLSKAQLNSKLQYKIAEPYTLNIYATPLATSNNPSPSTLSKENLDLASLYVTASDSYVYALPMPAGPCEIRIIIKDGESHPLFTGLFAVDVPPGTAAALNATLAASDVPRLVQRTLQDYFPLINGQLFLDTSSEQVTVYGPNFELINTEAQTSDTCNYEVVVATAPTILFANQLSGDTSALVNTDSIEEAHFRWSSGNLHYLGERQEYVASNYFISDDGDIYSMSNVTVKKALTLSANSIANIPMMPADFKLGQRYSATVTGQMKYSAVDPIGPTTLVYTFHPVEVQMTVDFLDLVDVGSHKDALRFVLLRKVYDLNGGGRRLILEDTSEVCYAAGFGKIQETSHTYEYLYDITTNDLFRVIHRKLTHSYSPGT